MALWRKFETEEAWKARPHIGDPGYTIDDLALKPDDYHKIGLETPEDRKVREAKHMAFWRRPDVLRELALPEEDLPPNRRGKPHRHFKSVNIIDLVPWLKKERDAG